MKYLMLLIIRVYWLLIPSNFRRSCLFSVSCSKYVYHKTKMYGMVAGIIAFKNRYKQCRPGYKIGYNSLDGTKELHLVDGTILREEEIACELKQNK